MQVLLLLLSLAYVAAGDSNLRGNGRPEKESVLCRFTHFDVFYDNNDFASNTEEQYDTRCIPIVDGKETDLDFKMQLPEALLRDYAEEIEQGKLLVTISNAKINENDKLVFVGGDPEFTVYEDGEQRFRHLQERHLQTTGTKTLAIIRVSTADSSPTGTASSVSSIQNVMFGNGINFVTQYNECSFGKLKWQMAEPVFDVRVDGNLASYGNDPAEIITAVQDKVKAQRGISAASDIADKVIMCLPPGTGDWAASAGVNHWRVQANDKWCT